MTEATVGLSADLQGFLEALPFSAILMDTSHHVVAANQTAIATLGLDGGCIPGGCCPHLARGRTEPIPDCPLRAAIAKGAPSELSVVDPQTMEPALMGAYPTRLRTDSGDEVYLHLFKDVGRHGSDTTALCRSLEHHRALCALLQGLQPSHSSAELLQVLVDRLVEVSWLGVETRATAFLVEGEQMTMVASRNLEEVQLRRCQRLTVGECICGRVAESGQRWVHASGEACDEHRDRASGDGEHGHAVLPLRHEGRVLGVLNLYLRPDDDLDEFRIEFLEAATAAAATALAEQLARENALRVQAELEATRRQMIERVIESEETERRRVSRELHDQLGQSLSALLLEVEASRNGGDDCHALGERVAARVHQMVDDVRRMAWELRPAILDDYGLESALARHIENLGARAGLTIDYQGPDPDAVRTRLPERLELVLYRVLQESMTNIVRHARASRVSVIYVREDQRAMLLVEDDGQGFDVEQARRSSRAALGLVGMEERVNLVGGTLTLESTPGQGTTLRVEIPLADSPGRAGPEPRE
jgi:signal transduction histidine kinase